MTGELIATKFTKIGGTSSQFLMADGSSNNDVYYTQGASDNKYVNKITTVNNKSLNNNINLNINDILSGNKIPAENLDIINDLIEWINDKLASAEQIKNLNIIKENVSNKGVANGYAPLDSSSKIPLPYLNGFIATVEEYANFPAFPSTGITNTNYVALDDSLQYRWSGSIYINITEGAD